MVVACVMGWEQGEAGRSAEGIKFSGWAWRDRRAGGPFLGATIVIAIDDDDDEHIDSQAALQRRGKEHIILSRAWCYIPIYPLPSCSVPMYQPHDRLAFSVVSSHRPGHAASERSARLLFGAAGGR